jgi:hypothetical protein
MSEHELEDAFPDCAPIFVVGTPRSGTTLVQRMLDAHPNLAVFDELTYFDGILKLRTRVPDLRAPGAVDRLFEAIPRLEQYPYWRNVDDLLAETRRRLAADPRPSYPRFYRYFLEAHARRAGKRRWGDKSPANVRRLDALWRMFPGARVIHAIRDPRATVASRLKAEWSSSEVLSTALKWRLDVEAGRRFAAGGQAQAAAYAEVRYEDLVRDPERELRRLCRHLGEPFASCMLDYHRSSDVAFQAAPWKAGVFRPVSAASIDRWRSEISPPRLALIELVAGGTMRRLGYEPTPIGYGDRARMPIQAAREIALWVAHRRAIARRRAAQPHAIGADARQLWRMLWRTLSRRAP